MLEKYALATLSCVGISMMLTLFFSQKFINLCMAALECTGRASGSSDSEWGSHVFFAMDATTC